MARPHIRGRGARRARFGKTSNSTRAPKRPLDQEGSNAEQDDGGARKKVRWQHSSRQRSNDDESSDSEDSEPLVVGSSCFAITGHRTRMGCAFFDSANATLHLLEDTQDSARYDLAEQILEQVNPDFVIVSSKADENLITVCKTYMEEKEKTCQVRPHREFTPVRGKEKLYSLPLFTNCGPDVSSTIGSSDSAPSGTRSTRSAKAYEFMRNRTNNATDPDVLRWQAAIRVSNFVDGDQSPLCVSAAGALLDQLHRTRAFGELDGDTESVLVSNIEILRPEKSMQINMDALLSLQIFGEQTHASIHSDKTKEALSLFGTLNYTKTRLGYDLLRRWLLRPSIDLDVIQARHDALECFLLQDNLSVCGNLRAHLKGIRNVPQMLLAMQRGKGETRDWETLCRFSFHAAMLADSLTELSNADEVEIVQKLNESLSASHFKEMGEDVNNIIDWEESARNGRACIRPHIDEELDKFKELYDGLDSLMNRCSTQISTEVSPDRVPALNVVYFPHLGFFISVPLPDEESAIVGEPDWTFQFKTDNTIFFKSPKMHDLDHHIGDIQPIIAERELEIVHALYERVIPFAPAVDAACNIMAELDCLLSLAQASLIHNYVRPTMTDENIIVVRGGRHPLQEQIVDMFIPNDVFIVGGLGIGSEPQEDAEDVLETSQAAGILDQKAHSVMVVTGANACGKSVYLKQVALIQFMAQIGCFVPAESAAFGLVDKRKPSYYSSSGVSLTIVTVFTRVQNRESVSKLQSSFMIDLNQVSLALRNVTHRSLVLLDEFGKGTLETDGAGLLIGVLRHLVNRGINCPKVLATTHYRGIFREDIIATPSLMPLLLAHMRVMLAREAGTDGIVYLYQIAPGLSLESHAAKCAAMCGLSASVVQRAQYVTELVTKHEIGLLLDERMTVEEEDDLRDAEAVFKRFAAWKLGSGEGKTKERLQKVLGLN